MTAIENLTDIVDAIRRCERRAKAKNPERPALVPGAAARVISNGRITVELPTVDGGAVIYTATPVSTWRYEPASPPRRPIWLKRPAPAPASPHAQLKAAIDMTLNALVSVERAAQPKPDIAAT
jgi:hypothetical protein